MTLSLELTGDPYGPWYDHTIVIYDVETTGLDETQDRIVEMGFARFEKRELVAQWGTLVYPGIEIPAESTAIHGISTADVAQAPSFHHTMSNIVKITHGAWPAAYNEAFDRKFWNSEQGRAGGFDLPTPIFHSKYRWLDPLIWIRHMDGLWGKNKLTVACERYGVELNNAHRATDDAVAAGKLLFALDLPAMSMFEMLRVQAEIAEVQDRERESWFRKKGLPYEKR